MRHTTILLISAGVFLSSAGFALAQTAPGPATAAPAAVASVGPAATSALAPPNAGAPGYKTELVCHAMPPPTGSRLGSRRVCLTQYDWDKQRLQAESNTQDAQLKNKLLDGN